jgi:hypothetical protein
LPEKRKHSNTLPPTLKPQLSSFAHYLLIDFLPVGQIDYTINPKEIINIDYKMDYKMVYQLVCELTPAL